MDGQGGESEGEDVDILDTSSNKSSAHTASNHQQQQQQQHSKTLQRPIIRGAQACTACRQSKIKCNPNGSTAFPCRRCVSLGIVCEVLKHNRGRKRKNADEEPPRPKPQATYYSPDNNKSSGPSGGQGGVPPSPQPRHGSLSAPAPGAPSSPPDFIYDQDHSRAFGGPPASTSGRPRHPFEAELLSPDPPPPPGESGAGSRSNLHILEEAIAMQGQTHQQHHHQSHNNIPAPVLGSAVASAVTHPEDNPLRESPSLGTVPAHAPLAGPALASGGVGVRDSPALGAGTVTAGGPAGPGGDIINGSSSVVDLSSLSSASNTIKSPLGPAPAVNLGNSTGTALNTSSSNNAHTVNEHQQRHSSSYPFSAQNHPAGAATVGLPLPSISVHQMMPSYGQPPTSAGYQQHTHHPHSSSTSAQHHPHHQHPQQPAVFPYPQRALPDPLKSSTASSSAHASRLQLPGSRESSIHAGETRPASRASAGLESLKFPFLLPKTERPGRRGMFCLKSLMNAEEVEEIGPGPQSLHQSEAFLLANDPITAGVISLEDARTLFKLYMDEMSTTNCLLDWKVHTHDFVRARSSFLYTAVLSVISRYLNSTTYAADGTPKRMISPVYAYCKQAAKAHLKDVLGSIDTSLEVVQGLAIMTYHKEVEDEKSCLHLYRAIAIAREIGIDLDLTNGRTDLSEEERDWMKIKQRVWMSLFVANTILTMQFDMKTLIGPEDPAIAGSARFAVGSPYPNDTLLVANVQMRRLWHIYTEMAKALDRPGETTADKSAKLISLSIITRTANRELEQTAADWREECVAAGLGRVDMKVNVWLAAIKLKLNLAIVQMVLPGLKERSGSSSFAPPNKSPEGRERKLELGCVAAFHHAVNAACMILHHMVALEEKRLLSFAADTFLHFAIYSAFFLWTLCHDQTNNLLESGEVEHCFVLVSNAAGALESASLYPGDSPALHARFLRNLLQSRALSSKPESGPDAVTAGGGPGIFGPQTAFASASGSSGGSIPATLPSPLQNMHNNLTGPHGPQPGLSFTSTPTTGLENGFNGAEHFPDPNFLPNKGYDAVLTADWNTMQKDFPWAFNDFAVPWPDTATGMT